jgi:hypothetical protein
MEKKIIIKDEKNDFKKIIIEDKEFYNSKGIEGYPFMHYLTDTNFCSINDFKNQFYCLMNDKENYPMINCILNNSDIIIICSNLDYINSFINEIYNELVLKITKKDINNKLKDVLSENVRNKIDQFNGRINEINKLKSFCDNKINEINSDTKISDFINIKDNSLNKFYQNIINIYNTFLMNTKIYKDNKNLIEPIFIQSASKNDYYIFNDENTTAYDKLQEIICLYSKRNRYKNDLLNVYNGSKINYDYNQIENILQKEYLYGKRPFKQMQKTFIFANDVFNEERDDLILKIKKKYPQVEISDEILQTDIDNYFNDENKSKDNFIKIYINLQYIMIYLTIYDNNNYDSAKIPLEYIAKVIKKENYQLDDLLIDFLNQQSNKLFINNLLYLYEKAEIKCFEYLTEQIDINEKDKNISTEKESKIKEYFSDSDLLLKEDIMINSIKKYILRYCIGSDIDNNNIFKNCDLEKLVNKEDIWNNKIYQDDKFKVEFEKLKELNDEENNIMKYFFKTLFKVKTDKEKKEDKKEKENTIVKKEHKRKKNYKMKY